MKAKIPKSIREGDLLLGPRSLPCAVLEDGAHIISCLGFLKALGRPWRKTYKSVDWPGFLAAQNLAPFLDESLRSGQKPIEFRTLHGGRKSGYEADLLPKSCEVYTMARSAGVLRPNQTKIAIACADILRDMGDSEIEDLIDEATGYQEIRDLKCLHEYLDRRLPAYLAEWSKRIPEAFYREMFRLKGWKWSGMSLTRPGAVGKLTNDIVFERIEPFVLSELAKNLPGNNRTRKKRTPNYWLNNNVGHPALDSHVFAVVGLMRASANWSQFHRLLQRSFPKNETVMKERSGRRRGAVHETVARQVMPPSATGSNQLELIT